jgi:NitT/TauT family transport system substrate-binding protein
MRTLRTLAVAALGALALIGTPMPLRAAAPVKITAAIVPAVSAGGLYIAEEKGYFRAAGLDVDIQDIESGSDLQAMLATNRVQVISGALSAAMFNSMAQNFPVRMFYAVAVSPAFHYFMVRPDLKDKLKTPADLRGRSIAISGRATGDYYAVGKVLAAAGLTLADADVKTVGFSQMAAALQNKAIDVAVLIPPLTDAVAVRGIAVKWLNPEDYLQVKPELIAVGQMNTDWTNTHEAAAKAFLKAILRGTREYCEAYHFGANRAEVVRILAKYSSIHNPALIEKIEWGASDPEGVIPVASIKDFQDFDVAHKLIAHEVPMDRVAELGWIREAARALGPFKLAHDDGTPGCR